MDLTELFEAILTVVVIIVGRFLVPWLKTKVETTKLNKALDVIDIAVGAAEQIAKGFGYDGEWKKQYVVDYLEKANITVGYDLLDNAIENAVLKLHNELKTTE